MAGIIGEEMKNKQVIFRDFVCGFPKESDFIITTSTMKLKLPEASNGVLLKTLYLSCDPFMRMLMESRPPSTSYSPGSLLFGFGVGKVLESAHSDFREGDLVWGMLKWEEYSVVEEPAKLFKIQHTDVPLDRPPVVKVYQRRHVGRK